MTRILMLGFGEAFLNAVAEQIPADSVVVLEEPDVIRKRDLTAKAAKLACVAELVPAAYQQADEFVDVGVAIDKRWGVQAVVPALEYAVPAAAALAARLGLPGATENAAGLLRDKLRLREAAQGAGIRNPAFREIHGPDDVVAFAAGRPVVVKPANRQGSVGVHLLDRVDPAGAEAAWRAMTSADEAKIVPDRPLHWRYAVEERLYGPEYSVEALVSRRELLFCNVTEKAVVPGIHPVELGHVVPAALDPAAQAEFREAMLALIEATGFESGILHAEWIRTDAGPTLIECAGRCPGDRLVDLVDLAYGTRLRLALIELLAGGSPVLPDAPRAGAAIRFLSGEPGTVQRVEGLDEARALPGVVELSLDAAPGARIRTWTSSLDRPGYLITTGADSRQAADRARAGADTVRIVTA